MSDTSYTPDTSSPSFFDTLSSFFTSTPSTTVDTTAATPAPSMDLASVFPSGAPSTGVPTPPTAPIDWSQYNTALPPEVTAYAQPAADQLSSGLYNTGAAQPSQGALADLLSGRGLSSADLSKLLVSGGTGLLGLYTQGQSAAQAKKAQQQYLQASQQAAKDYQASVAQQRQPASASLSEALQGKFDDASLRAFKAAESRLAQGAASTGGVGAAQSTAALESARQSILQNQIKVAEEIMSGTDPQIMAAIQATLQGQQGALMLGIDLQKEANAALNNLYTSLGRGLA